MDFNYRKPAHIFAASLVTLSILVFVILPIVSFFGVMSTDSATDELSSLSNDYAVFMELFILLLQMVFVIFLFVLVPLIWYKLVNHFSFKEMLSRLRLRIDGIDKAVMWGVFTAVAAFVVMIGMSSIIQLFGVNAEDAGNIKDLELYFSIPSILLLSTFQPIAEEIFFRGFLLEKIGNRFGNNISILVTSVLFGLAHLLNGNVIPAIMTGIIGILLAYIVLKTKNLYAAITAHILFNLTSVILYIIGKAVLFEALIL
jgi:membrane protease YdiL (CAAX protease family)